MAKATLRSIMKRGHEIARKLEGDYQARLSYGLKVAWAEYKKEVNGMNEIMNGTPQRRLRMGNKRNAILLGPPS